MVGRSEPVWPSEVLMGVRDDRRWMGVGRSAEGNSWEAGARAADAALSGRPAALVLVFAGIDHEPEALLAGVRSVAGDAPVIGCSTHGEIGPGGPTDGTVVVSA